MSSRASATNEAQAQLPVILSAWDLLSWIAIRELRPRPELPQAVEFANTWGSASAEQMLEAFEARASSAPYCIWEPLALDGQPWDCRSFKHAAWSPTGPKMLRWVLRKLGPERGRHVTFGAAAVKLREQLEDQERYNALVAQARRVLNEAMRAARLRAWGKQDLAHAQPNPAAQYKEIEASIFLDELVSITEWSTIGADPYHPSATVRYRGPSFRDVRFYSVDVLPLWPARTPSETVIVLTVAGEKRLSEWLTKLMNGRRDSPMSKAAVKARATTEGLSFGTRAFDRAWANSVRESGAIRWARPGRKS